MTWTILDYDNALVRLATLPGAMDFQHSGIEEVVQVFCTAPAPAIMIGASPWAISSIIFINLAVRLIFALMSVPEQRPIRKIIECI